jgi:hypothetical protein
VGEQCSSAGDGADDEDADGEVRGVDSSSSRAPLPVVVTAADTKHVSLPVVVAVAAEQKKKLKKFDESSSERVVGKKRKAAAASDLLLPTTSWLDVERKDIMKVLPPTLSLSSLSCFFIHRAAMQKLISSFTLALQKKRGNVLQWCHPHCLNREMNVLFPWRFMSMPYVCFAFYFFIRQISILTRTLLCPFCSDFISYYASETANPRAVATLRATATKMRNTDGIVDGDFFLLRYKQKQKCFS